MEHCYFCLTKKDLSSITTKISSIINSFFTSFDYSEAQICLNCMKSFQCFEKFRQNCLTAQTFLSHRLPESDFRPNESINSAFDTILTWLDGVSSYLDIDSIVKVEEEGIEIVSIYEEEHLKEEDLSKNGCSDDDETLEKYFKESLQGQRRPYQCPICGKNFTKGELKYHLNVHKNLKPFKCVIEGCASRFSSPRIMRVHARRFHQMKVKPERSQYKRRRIQDERYHDVVVEISEQDKSKINVVCSECGKEVRKKHFSNHFQTHLVGGSTLTDFSCPYKDQGCTEIFRMRHLLTSHIQKRHDPSFIPELRPADRICELCGKCFTKSTMKYHMNVHLGVTPYSCDFEGCNEAFKDPTLLRQHKRTLHLKIKSFRCRYCPKKIYTQEEYDKHKTENCGVKSVACHICGKFINKMNIKCHLAIHKGERNFICPEEGCGKAFLLKNKLKQHSKSHSTECNYVCTVCKTAAFKCKQSLTSHMMKKHGTS